MPDHNDFFMAMGANQYMNATREPGTPAYETNGSMESHYANQNIALQREFAKNGVRWKIADGVAAGIHPLYAVGAQGASFSPVNYEPPQRQSDPFADFMMGLINVLGQNILGSVFSGSTQNEREETYASLKLSNAQLENQLLQNQVLNATAPPSMGPPLPSAGDYPIPGQTSSSVMVKPFETTATSRYNRGTDAGAIPSLGWMRNADGGYTPVQSAAAKERTEDDFFAESEHAIRNRLIPAAKGLSPPPRDVVHLPKNMKWQWDPVKQAYYKVLNRGPSPYSLEFYNGPVSYLKSRLRNSPRRNSFLQK